MAVLCGVCCSKYNGSVDHFMSGLVKVEFEVMVCMKRIVDMIPVLVDL